MPRVLGILVLAAAMFVVPCSAQAADLLGTIEVRESHVGNDGRERKDVTAAWTFGGPVDGSGGRFTVTGVPRVDSYTRRVEYTDEFGHECHVESFAGWFPGSQNPVQQKLAFTTIGRNLLTRQTLLTEFRWLGTGPLASLTNGDCAGLGSSTFEARFMGSDTQGSDFHGARAVLGSGLLTTETASATSTLTPSEYLAPSSIRMVLRDGLWRAAGSLTRTGTFNTLSVAGTRTVTVTWNLRSRVPSTMCVAPLPRQLRGLTMSAARAVVRRAGFRPGASIPVFTGGVASGRVTGIATRSGGRGAPCGSRVDFLVARRA